MSKKILVIDDDPLFGAVIQTRLQTEGFLVHLCHTGEEGIRTFKNFGPDLVLLDIVLVGENSGEIFDRIKALNPLAKIVTASAHGGLTTNEKEQERGAESFYDKAKNSVELINIVKAALGE